MWSREDARAGIIECQPAQKTGTFVLDVEDDPDGTVVVLGDREVIVEAPQLQGDGNGTSGVCEAACHLAYD